MWARVALLLTLVLLRVCADPEERTCPKFANLSIVYNCFIWPDQNWELLVRSQLENLVSNGLADCATIDVVVSIPAAHAGLTYEQLEEILKDARELVRSLLPILPGRQPRRTIVSQVHENSFEYPGLHLLWSRAQASHPEAYVSREQLPASFTLTDSLERAQNLDHINAQNTVFLYFHTKEMVNHGRQVSRPAGEASFFRGIIDPWQQIVAVFESNTTVTRVANFPAEAGWLWHNFWWARASYLKTVVEPIRTARRHYYEDWLGRLYNEATEQDAEPVGSWAGCDTCYSFNGNCSGYGVVYSPADIVFCDGVSA